MAKQSLAAQSGALTVPTLDLPAPFSAPNEPIKARQWPPYVSFAHHQRQDEWTKITSKYKNVSESDMFLIVNDDVIELRTAKMGYMQGKQFWAQTNANGEVQKVSWEEMPFPWQERVEAVVLVYLEDRVVPANIQFRTVKCGAAKKLSDALALCQTAGWLEQGAEYAAVARIQQPFLRFYGEVVVQAPRPSKSSGRPYRPAACTIKPTGKAEWEAVRALTEDPNTKKILDMVAQRYESQIREMTAKVA